jgi:hypothetical protein
MERSSRMLVMTELRRTVMLSIYPVQRITSAYGSHNRDSKVILVIQILCTYVRKTSILLASTERT